jgi:peptidoglycan-N-acetylglucosamine deacetylase
MNVQVPDWLRYFWRSVTWRKVTSKKEIYLTFDDGPVPEATPQVLRILATYDVKATFFCVGNNVVKYPEVYKMVLDEGHRVGNHTYNHIKGYVTSHEEYLANVEMATQVIKSDLFRPPHGHITRSQIKALRKDYEIVMWDLITHDYNKALAPDVILNTIKKKTRRGSIIVFHDSIKARDNVLSVLPEALEYWKSEGYDFKLL